MGGAVNNYQIIRQAILDRCCLSAMQGSGSSISHRMRSARAMTATSMS